jgi:methyl-accepting chemotaxis protein
MVKLNRIGNKLGLAGAVGVLLAIGMVANQMATESSVAAVNDRADRSQRVASSTAAAQLDLRQIQLAGRSMRLAATSKEVDKNLADVHRFRAAEIKEVEAALASAVKPETRERLQNIKSLMDTYISGVEDLAKAESGLLAQAEKRNAISAEWTRAIEGELASPSLSRLANRRDIESLLHLADAKVNAISALVWRFGATGETDLIATITQTETAVNEVFNEARHLSEDKEFQDAISSMDMIVKKFFAANAESVRLDAVKKDIIRDRTVKIVDEAGQQMETAVATAQKNTDISKQEAVAEADRAGRINFGLGIVVVIAIAGSVVFSFLGISRPMMRLNEALGQMAAGNLGISIPGADRGDEIGDLAKAVTVIRENAERKAHAEGEAKVTQDRIAAQQRKAEMVKMADDFESAVGKIVETVSSASSELEASAGTLTKTADRAQELTTMVAAASEEASTNVQSVASATEEMSSSVNEISRQVQESARMATDAVDQARKTNDRVGELSKAAARIGDVVELINTIAGQTNLLALNATIEAARAGEAGRGFAVVASEVKALAEQTAKATGEIGQQISSIQAATQESVGAIKEISGTIERLSEISSTIAAAVEEQGAATQEISRNVQQAAIGTQQVSSNITDVQRGAGETGSASSQVLSAAQSLSGESNRLKLEVGKFLNSVRAA